MNRFSFRELSALGVAMGILLVCLLYFPDALRVTASLGPESAASATVVPMTFGLIGIAVAAVIALIIFVSIYHGVIAVIFRDEADERADERDQAIDRKARLFAYGILDLGGVALFACIWWFELSGPMAAQFLLLLLFLSEACRYLAQFILYRIGG